MWKDFKEFAFKGNIIDLAVAVVIGGAFGKIVASLVENIIMPFITAISIGGDFNDLYFKLNGSPITYGVFIQSVIDFFIIAFVIFLAIRLLAKFQRKQEAVEEATPEIDTQEALLTEIRDLLKEQNNK